MIDVGLVSHEFKAKAILEEELFIVAGIHPSPDRYEGPLDAYSRLRITMNRAVVRKFIPNDVLAIQPSPSNRSILSTPSEAPSASVPRVVTPPPPQSYTSAFPQGTPIIKVSTSPEESTPFQTPLEVDPSSPIPPPVEAVSSSQKRPRIEEVPVEESPAGEASKPLVFPARVLTPHLEPRLEFSTCLVPLIVLMWSCSPLAPFLDWQLFPDLGIRNIPAAVAAMVENHGPSFATMRPFASNFKKLILSFLTFSSVSMRRGLGLGRSRPSFLRRSRP
ncbi:hypothetical protein Salat_2547400 [Sesamum alatum]|uniref:Uncharacterized protein n=1 Tax=Sesamum alatum TaxID=300844 RepID=A0AAE1XSE7_9LAMI|nr:hypothetical protein Salat_2547400 [Sesamum alatum]